MKDELKLLNDILNTATVNSKDDEGKLAEFLAEYFQSFGIESHVDRIDEKHANVIARIEGQRKDRSEVWNGHLDTVPYGDLSNWDTDPQVATEKNGKIYARGASDMKSGLAAMVYALTHLQGKPENTIYFIGTCDEEKGGLGARAVLEKGELPDYDLLLIGEPTALLPGTAQKGCLWLKMKVKGKTGHGAYPEKGVNAIEQCYLMYQEIKKYLQDFHHPLLSSATVQLNKVTGGHTMNMTADDCEGWLDIRFVPPLKPEEIMQTISGMAEKRMAQKKDLHIEIEIVNQRRAFELEETDEAVTSFKEILGTEKSIGIYYFTDASVLAADAYDKKVLLFGPGHPDLAHQPNEYVEIPAYQKAIEALRRFAIRKRG